MAGGKTLRGRARRRADGRHSFWGQLLQRGCLRSARNFRARMVAAARRPSPISRTTSSPRSGARTGVSRSTTGTRCGRGISTGGASVSRGVKEIFHVFRIDHVLGFYRIYAFPWRPERNAGNPAARLRRKCSSRPAAAHRNSLRATIVAGKLRAESPRRRGISARRSRRIRRDPRGRRRSRHGPGLRPA